MRLRYSRVVPLRTLLTSALLCLAGVAPTLPIPRSVNPLEPTRKATVLNSSSSSGASVEIDGRPIFQVYAAVGGIAPEERAANIKQRILRPARKRGLG
jgi:hypothetical protein